MSLKAEKNTGVHPCLLVGTLMKAKTTGNTIFKKNIKI